MTPMAIVSWSCFLIVYIHASIHHLSIRTFAVRRESHVSIIVKLLITAPSIGVYIVLPLLFVFLLSSDCSVQSSTSFAKPCSLISVKWCCTQMLSIVFVANVAPTPFYHCWTFSAFMSLESSSSVIGLANNEQFLDRIIILPKLLINFFVGRIQFQKLYHPKSVLYNWDSQLVYVLESGGKVVAIQPDFHTGQPGAGKILDVCYLPGNPVGKYHLCSFHVYFLWN